MEESWWRRRYELLHSRDLTSRHRPHPISSPTSCDVGPHHYLFGDSSALKAINQARRRRYELLRSRDLTSRPQTVLGLLFPHLLGCRSPPIPLRCGVKNNQQSMRFQRYSFLNRTAQTAPVSPLNVTDLHWRCRCPEHVCCVVGRVSRTHLCQTNRLTLQCACTPVGAYAP